MQEHERTLTTASGRPYVENDNTMTVGPRGPILLQDYILHEKMAHFNRERIKMAKYHSIISILCVVTQSSHTNP